MAKKRPSFGGKRAMIVKRGTPCGPGRIKRIIRTKNNPHVEMCLIVRKR